MKKQVLLLLVVVGLSANPFLGLPSEQKIAVQNSILAKVNGKTISMIDVKKKMDMIFHQNFSQFADSNMARYQFYEAHWKRVLMDMIDHELIISDALDREIKLSDGEVREEMEKRFGPNVMRTLDKIGLTYDETWKMVKNEMIVQRMTGWFVYSKALSNVTPQDIRQAYRLYLKENPPYSEWAYQVISIRLSEDDDACIEKIYQTLQSSGKSPDLIELKEFESPGISISLSNEYTAKTQDLSEIHRASLESLSIGSYSKPSFQISRADQKSVYRVFYLKSKTDFPAPSFDQIAAKLKDELESKALAKESESYIAKLRKHYGFDADNTIPEDFHPFSLQ